VQIILQTAGMPTVAAIVTVMVLYCILAMIIALCQSVMKILH